MFLKFIEAGFSVIPVHARSKRPIITGWSFLCENMPSSATGELWESLYKDSNIGLACGSASKIIALDIDTDDERTLNLCPPSPVRKRGLKGETRFFKYSKNIQSRKYHDKKVEILANGNQTILPPSLHEKTGLPYVWLSKDSFPSFSPSDLPELNLDFIEKLPVIISEVKNVNGSNEFSEFRNDKLKNLCWAMLSRFESDDKILEELIKFDSSEFSNPLFGDKNSEYGNLKTEQDAAAKFLSNIKRSFQQFGPELVVQPDEDLVIEIKEKVKDYNKTKDLPVFTGILKLLENEIIDRSHSPQPNLAKASALSIFSTFCLGRYQEPSQWPVIYNLMAAPSGYGKGAPLTFARSFFDLPYFQHYNLRGFESPQSDIQFYVSFLEQRTRLDVYNENSSFYEELLKSEGFAKKIQNMQIKVFDLNGGYFGGSKSKDRKDAKDTGECYGPAVNILADIQPTLLLQYGNVSLFSSGYLPRFCTYLVTEKKNYNSKPKPFYESLSPDLLDQLSDLFPNARVADPLDQKSKPQPKVIPFSKAAEDFLTDIGAFRHSLEFGRDIVSASLNQRFVQKIKTHALLFALSDQQATISLEHTVRAQAHIEVLEAQSLSYLKLVGAMSQFERERDRLSDFLNYLQKEKGFSKYPISLLTDDFPNVSNRRDHAIDELVAAGKVQRMNAGELKLCFP